MSVQVLDIFSYDAAMLHFICSVFTVILNIVLHDYNSGLFFSSFDFI